MIKIIHFTILTILSLFIGRYFISSQLNNAHDSVQYITSLVEFTFNLQSGYWFPEWAPHLGNGNGHPLFIFLPPGFYYIGAVLYFLGFTSIESVNGTVIIGIILSSLGIYTWLQKWVSKETALFAGIVLITSPYFLVDLYVRGAYGEFFGFAFLPWILHGVDKIIKDESLGILTIVVFISLSILFHNTVAVMALISVCGYAIGTLKNHRDGSFLKVTKISFAILLSLLLTSYFWLPALLLKSIVSTHKLLIGYLAYQNHFISPSELFGDNWGYGLLGYYYGDKNWMPQEIGTVVTIGILSYALLANKLKDNKYQICNLLFITLFFLFLTTAYSKFIWDRAIILQYFQFGMRFLLPATIFGTGFISLLIDSVFKNYRIRYILISCLSLLLLVQGIIRAKPESKYLGTPDMHSPLNIAKLGLGAVNKEEFAPRGVWIVPQYNYQAISQLTQGTIWDEKLNTPFLIQGELNVTTDSGNIRFNRHCFLGWKLFIYNKQKEISCDNIYNQISFSVPKGKYPIEVIFTGARKKILLGNLLY